LTLTVSVDDIALNCEFGVGDVGEQRVEEWNHCGIDP
jgi:hypothetical protein